MKNILKFTKISNLLAEFYNWNFKYAEIKILIHFGYGISIFLFGER